MIILLLLIDSHSLKLTVFSLHWSGLGLDLFHCLCRGHSCICRGNSCSWLFIMALITKLQVHKALDVEASIKRVLESAVRERCDCNFSSRSIFSGEFSCQSTSSLITHVIYRATINGTSDLLTTNQIMKHIDDWRESRGTLLYKIFRLKVSSKSECPLTIDSFDDQEC